VGRWIFTDIRDTLHQLIWDVLLTMVDKLSVQNNLGGILLFAKLFSALVFIQTAAVSVTMLYLQLAFKLIHV